MLGSFNGLGPGSPEAMIRSETEKEPNIPWFTQRTSEVPDTGLVCLTKAPDALLRGVKAQGAFSRES